MSEDDEIFSEPPEREILLSENDQRRHEFLLGKLERRGLVLNEIIELQELRTGGPIMDPSWRSMPEVKILEALTISESVLRQWTENGCPKNEVDGVVSFDCGKLLKWRIFVQQEMDRIDGDLAGGINSEALEQYRRVRVDQERFKLEIKLKKFVEIEYFEKLVRDTAESMRMGLQNIGRKISVLLSRITSPKECEELMDKEISNIVDKEINVSDSDT